MEQASLIWLLLPLSSAPTCPALSVCGVSVSLPLFLEFLSLPLSLTSGSFPQSISLCNLCLSLSSPSVLASVLIAAPQLQSLSFVYLH